MRHQVCKGDIKADLRRSVMASFAPEVFDDVNVQAFLAKAEENLEVLKNKVGKRTYQAVMGRIRKAKNSANPDDKRREDLLTAASLL